MGIPYFDGDQIAHDAYLVLSGSSNPNAIIYPRTIGGILQESGVVEKTAKLRCYLIPPESGRYQIESYMHELNEKIGSKEADLEVNGNTYLNMNVESIEYDRILVNNFIRFDINFKMSEQNEGGSIRQLSVPDLQMFSRGRKGTFDCTLDDGEEPTFNFWDNLDIIDSFETQITLKRSGNQELNAESRGLVIRRGGFEKTVVLGWVIGPENNTRQNLEAYFYNMINGPLGRLGTFKLDGRTIKEKTVFSSVSMEDTTNKTIKYELGFVTSLQC